MTKVYGTVDSLKRIRETLDAKGISEFNSIGDIRTFKSTFESNLNSAKREFDRKKNEYVKELEVRKENLYDEINQVRQDVESEYATKMLRMDNAILRIRDQTSSNMASRIINRFKLKRYKGKLNRLERKCSKQIKYNVEKLETELYSIDSLLQARGLNQSTLLREVGLGKVERLYYIKEILDEIEPLIAGAIGEHRVHQELLKLDDRNTLFNDYYYKFDPPLFNRITKKSILTIQIDHLLVTRGGVFVIETKNWSEESLSNRDLRSPVEQLNRSGYGVFALLNRHGNLLDAHHWGKKKITVKSVLVFTGKKPNQKFEFIKTLQLDELNNYINYFDPIYSQHEVTNIVDYLRRCQLTR